MLNKSLGRGVNQVSRVVEILKDLQSRLAQTSLSSKTATDLAHWALDIAIALHWHAFACGDSEYDDAIRDTWKRIVDDLRFIALHETTNGD